MTEAVVPADLGLSRRPRKTVWMAAIVIAACLHGAAFAYAWSRLHNDEREDAVGAPSVEIGLDLSAPHQEPTDLPPGPEADASTASTAAVSQTVKVEDTDLPKAKPVETDDPDRLVAPDATKTPQDQKPKLQESKANPAADAVASEATAPPNIEAAKESARSVSPAQGVGDSLLRVRTTWQKELVAHLNRFKRYPSTGSRRAVQIVVGFTLDRFGHVVSSRVETGSGDPAFDRAALAMMASADPVPAPPPLIADEGLTFSLPVIFRDRKR